MSPVERPPRQHPLVLTDDLEGMALHPDDVHHVSRVLRVRAGDPISVGDGAGRWRLGRWTGDGVEPDGDVMVEPEHTPAITVAFAPTKSDRPAWTVQKLTEVGADRIVVMRAERSVVTWEGDRAVRHLDRLRRVAREATMQSRRTRVPAVEGPVEAAELLRAGASLAEPGGTSPTLRTPTVAIGPEGGWGEEERAIAQSVVDLGDTVLRTETAALVAATLLVQARRLTRGER